MTLEEANKELDRLYNELEFLNNRKFAIETIVTPSGIKYTEDKISGGIVVDKMIKYVELEEKYDLNNKIDFVKNKIKNLEEWIANELDILKDYGEVLYLVVYYKECYFIRGLNGVKRRLQWFEISNKLGYSEDYIKHIYSNYKNNKYDYKNKKRV